MIEQLNRYLEERDGKITKQDFYTMAIMSSPDMARRAYEIYWLERDLDPPPITGEPVL